MIAIRSKSTSTRSVGSMKVGTFLIALLASLTVAGQVVSARKTKKGKETTTTGEYEGMNVLCIGCSSGIGRSAAEILLRGGATVVISSRTQSKCDEVAKPFKNAYAIAADCTSSSEVLAELVEKSKKEAFQNGKITHLVWTPMCMHFSNLAASSGEDLIASLHDQLNAHVYGLIRMYKLIEQDLIDSASAGRGAAVVSVSSVMGSTNTLGTMSYGIAKTAQDRVIKDLALWGASNGIRSNAVAPAVINTPALDSFGDAEAKKAACEDFAWRHALGRIGESEEVGHMMAFLLSDKASFITGQVITIDGGVSLMNSFIDVNNMLLPPDIVQEKTYFSKFTAAPKEEPQL